MTKIGILATNNCMHSSISGPFDLFSIASIEWERLSEKTPQPFFDVHIISDRGSRVKSFNGTDIQPDSNIDTSDSFDIIFIPVIFGDLEPVLSNQNIKHWLINQHKQGACLCSVCAGSFVIAETRLLSERKATTHWNLAEDFKKRYPDVILKPEKMLIDEGDIITAGGVSAYLDLSLYIAGRFGSPELASSLSKIMLIDSARRSQSPYQSYSFQKSHGDKEILKAQRWVDLRFTGNISIPELANSAGLGERTFSRRFKKATGDTPVEYIQLMRIEAARKQLESTNETVDIITQKTGYSDISSFRRLFKKHTGLSPSAYRKKFSYFIHEPK